jgi:hypothetical protein
MESDTPRTDAEEVVYCEDEMCVPSSFSRQLERELAAAIKQRDEAQRDAERYRWLKSRGCYWVEIQSQPHGEYIFKGIGNARMDEGIDYEIAALRKENTKTDINEVDINEVDITEANINNQSFRERKLD